MDYDDNDFQSQNFQLVGEDSNKFPPSLRSFALPKFDFDEHLQVHLRFDSLVEPEVLLGIQDQENKWIEHFSPGSSAIEFSSSAAESCSISRHNNVWSEATSSESVEMLLKSVGEDEMVNKRVDTKEADAHDQLNGLDDQMDPLIRQDDSGNSRMGDIVHSDLTIQPDKSTNILPGPGEDAFRGQPQVEGMSQTSKDEKPEKDLDLISSVEKFSSDRKVVPEQCTADKTSSDEVINEFFEGVQDDDSLDNAFMRKSTPDDHGCATCVGTRASSEYRNTQDDPAATSIDRSGICSGKQSLSEQIMGGNKEVGMLEKSKGLQPDNHQKVYGQITCRDGKTIDQHSEGRALNHDFSSMKDSSCSEPSMDSLVYLNEECNESVLSENSNGLLEAIAYQGKALNKDNGTGDKVVRHMNEKSSLEVVGDMIIERHSLEVSNENIAKVPPITEASKNAGHDDAEFLAKYDDLHASILPINAKVADSGEERELSSFKEVIEEKQNLECQLSDKHNNDSHDSKPTVVQKSVEDKDLKDTNEKSNVTLNASEDASLEKSLLPILQHDTEVKVLSSTHDKSIEMKKSGTSEAKFVDDDVIPPDISVIGKEFIAPFVVSCGASSNTDTSNVTGRVEEASFTAQNAGGAKDGSSVTKLIQDESVTNPATIGVKSTSLNDSTVVCQSRPEDALAVDVVGEQKDAALSPLHASEHMHSVEKDVNISASVTKSNLDSQISSDPTTVADAVLDGSCPMNVVLDESEETIKKDEKQPLPVPPSAGESSPAIFQNGQQSDEANITPGGDCHGQNLVVETNCDASGAHANKSPHSTLSTSNVESRLLEPGSSIQGSVEPSCGSPTVISCTEHSQDGVEYREGSRGLLEHTGPTSGNPPHISSDAMVSAGKVKAGDCDSKECTASEDDRSFKFEVGSVAELSEKNTRNNWKPFSSMSPSELPQVSKDNSHPGPKESEEKSPHGTMTKTIGENKSKQVSSSGTRKANTSKRAAKETPSPKKAKERERKTCSTSPTGSTGISSNMRLEEMQQHLCVESSSMKVSCPQTVQTSNLPDLNTSLSTAALFHQPFTDLQQVQLRAQIFVYGSLIQGIPPDEACMISAFGGTDGGRSLWDGVWRAAAERLQKQKSPLNNSETPLHSCSGVRVSEQGTRSSPLQSKALYTPASRSGTKVVPSTVVNSTMCLPSPLWSTSSHDALPSNVQRGTHLDFNQVLSPMHSYQSSQMRHYTGNTTPWFSQSPRPGSWVVSSQSSTLGASSQHPAIPLAETIQVTPVKDSSTPRASNMQLVSPNTLPPTQAPISVSAASVVQAETQKKSAIPPNTRNTSTAQKSRKRKKGSALEEMGPVFSVSQPQTEPASATVVTKHLPTSAGYPLSTNSSTKAAPGGLVSATSTMAYPTHFQMVGSGNAEQRVILSEETCSRIEQSKLQAEDAAAHAAAAVRHSQGIWSQLATQKKSGSVSEVEEKLASAAVAAAAAASVAKAAAEAAKVASEAALQAKMMVEAALSSGKTGHPGQNSEAGLDVRKDFVKLTPVSILKGKDKVNGSSSIISVAREAARRRVEAASAATKRAENLDVILKAAELAAEAVSQAGIIVAMGDPLPFTISELVEAGPESYWKIQHMAIDKHAKANGLHQEENLDADAPNDHDASVKQSTEQPLGHRETERNTNEEVITSHSEQAIQLEENSIGITSVTFPTDRVETDSLASNLKGNSIRKGSLVEVVADEDGLRGVWFSARVLDVKDGKAFVCYNDLLPDEGTGRLEEWIPLESENNNAPRIRVTHPIAAAKPGGTRKRRREAVGNYAWAVGDRVDAWIRDGWWEGIVSEKSPGDETKLTVHFPAGGDSSIVRAWNLRPSLIWKNGGWMLWSHVRERNTVEPYEGDTPFEKRQKLGRLEGKIDSGIDGRGVGNMSMDVCSNDSRKPEDSRSLNLSAKDKVFSVGKNDKEENNSDALKVKRTGLQKVGSRVVFGVPKPGKKRKFMEVSKHYTVDKTEKASEGNDSIKFAKYLMPQTSRVWRTTTKVDSKGKRASNSKPKGLKSVKSQIIQRRGAAEGDSSSVTTMPASNGGESGHGSIPNVKASFNNEENNLGKKNLPEAGSLSASIGTADAAVSESSVPVPGVPLSKKSSAAVEASIGGKRKVTPATDKLTGTEFKVSGYPAKIIPDATGPRRSNRRIQPTSRLLEGLQSSLIISKIPSVSHDRGARAQHRGALSSRGNAQG
uniref:Uncharacterized protein LOC105043663 isoform X1 n=1 Tax=Elaeis guineensis var. tenera TaxID=51953 RepID=A0A6I9R301_ELAGV|nr:uncharacterized protein LOC105043663 isoform X1 [Elaeis guineensis]XP_010919598.1 uncharacterized protein LOC105043663 isoform X1 [Elaeis guineensis]XP_010919599.1 uncharacterized protein LOC105043663 isoform X1 [Elaeis guineensis]XP_029119970.1 uncharacterized protein LOC105043663 isoform X1 [Elaeis guineensis]